MAEISLDAPAVLVFSEAEMSAEREALLLECGSYPDKGLVVTEEDLDGIVGRFSSDGAPIKVEHMDTPLDPLGRVEKVWRDGSVLMAKLLFPPDLASFLRRRGVQKLSVGLSREAVGLALAEVSLVLKPRIQAAAMFGESSPVAPARHPPLGGKGTGWEFGGGVGEGVAMAGGDAVNQEKSQEKDREIARLSAALVSREVEGQVQRLKAEGRVVPATEGLVRALLSVPTGALVTLSAGAEGLPVSEVFLSYLQAQPPVVNFGEVALSGGGEAAAGTATRSHHHAQGDKPALTADEEAFLRKLGLDPAAVQHMMRHGNLPAHTGKGN